jgi:hypothetical protein
MVATALGVLLCIGGGLTDDEHTRKSLLLAGLVTFTLGALAASGMCILRWTSLMERKAPLIDDRPARDPDEILYAWCGGVLLIVVGLFATLSVVVAQTPAEDT